MDDWENIVIPDLLSDREKRLLGERKKVEESDTELSRDLFTQLHKDSPLLFTKKKPRMIEGVINEKLVLELEHKNMINIRNQKHQYKKQQEELQQQVKQNKRIGEIFGETQLDDYYEAYGDIESKYFHT